MSNTTGSRALDSAADGFGLLVIERSNDFGPRSNPDLPNVRIEITAIDPHKRFAQLKRSKKKHLVMRQFGLEV